MACATTHRVKFEGTNDADAALSRRGRRISFADELNDGEASPKQRQVSELNTSTAEPNAHLSDESEQGLMSLKFGLLQVGRVYEGIIWLSAQPVSLSQPLDDNMSAVLATNEEVKRLRPHLFELVSAPTIPAAWLRVVFHTVRPGPVSTSIHLQFADGQGTLDHQIAVTANVMGELKGTPQLRPNVYIANRHVDISSDSEANSDWSGFARG